MARAPSILSACALAALGLALSAAPAARAAGDIYVGVDEKGNPFFTDTPPTYQGFTRFIIQPSRSGSVYKDFAANFSRFDPIIEDQAGVFGVEPALLKSVIFAESAFNPEAVSHAGAQGLMQLMPHVQTRLGVTDPFSPDESIRGGAQLLGQLLGQYQGDQRLALAAYNAGPGAVSRYGGVPPFQETRAYVDKVETLYRHFSAKGLTARP